ncbi:MAG: rhodanese-like domain-containing protein [Firmicutes bacterium]|nr:rhodanese-like domain-containing protein [Bacillota bacterium]
MKRIIPFLLIILLLASCSAPEQSDLGYMQISESDALELMAEEKDYIILDVRTPEEFEERHIVGAINVPNETIGTEEIAELPDKDQMILVYCRSGNRSKDASQKLVELGYTNIIEFGGINNWTGKTTSGNMI